MIYLKEIVSKLRSWHDIAAQGVTCVDCGYEGRLLCSKCLEERMKRLKDAELEIDPDEC